jgi:cytosine/adenosine deaminase-related metal-dependent hydrolase
VLATSEPRFTIRDHARNNLEMGGIMKKSQGNNPWHGARCACCQPGGFRVESSRRAVLTAGAALAAAVPLLSAPVHAQPGGDPELDRLQKDRRVLLKGGVVLTLDPKIGDFAAADVLIEDGNIREIRPDIAASDAAVVDATNRILIPGFIDTHSHSYQGAVRGFMPDGLLNPDYNRDVQAALTPVYTADDAYAGVLLSALGFIEVGTTAVVDISQCSHTPEHSDGMIRALQEAGIRAVYSYHRGAGDKQQYPQDIKRLQKAHFSSKDQLLTLALTANLNANVYTLAREVGVQIVQHLVGADLNKQVTELAKAGVMRPGDEFVHCLGINDATWTLLKDAGMQVSLCAPIDMTMGHGTPTIQEALDHGFRPSLSSDHGVSCSQDMFSLMRATYLFQRLRAHERRRGGDKNAPAFLTCRDMLEFGTIAGARCAQLDGKVGTLTPGKEADIVMLRADRLDVWPLTNAYGTVVNFMNPSHVDAVFIAGKVKKWRGNLVGVDQARVMRVARETRDRLMERAKLKVDVLG